MPIPHLSTSPRRDMINRVSTTTGKPSSSGGPKNKRTRRRLWIRRGLLAAFILFCIGTIGLVGLFAYISQDLPDPNKINDRNVAESTKIYDRTGETLLYTVSGDRNRTVVPLNEIPDSLKQAVILLEDKNFYTNKGFSIRGILRSAWADVTQGSRAQGGSTITQQFVKNSILSPEKKISRKIKELILAIQIERKFSKDQILQLYLNEIPYGSTAYGVEAASQSYFGKPAKDLTLAQSATLAALPNRPSTYLNHQDLLKKRQEHALDQMVEAGHITADAAAEAKKEDVTITVRGSNIVAPHFVFYVRELLEKQFGEGVVQSGGLSVYTTLDIDKQRAAEAAIAEGMKKVEQYGGHNASLVSLDTKTGQIVAMVGSKDFFDKDIDGQVNVALTPQQPGSSFKPIVYAAAFEKGYTPDMILFDVTTTFKNTPTDWTPHNYDLSEHGPLPARKALAGSLNIPTAQVTYLTGVENILNLAKKLGYTTLDGQYGLALGLGVGEVRLLDHASAYATLAREGMRHQPTPILKVLDKHGKALAQFKDQAVQVMDATAARQINNVLSDDNNRAFVFGAGSRLTLKDRPVAAKTGTTQDYRDAWAMGYTPSIATGVWVGNNDNKSMKGGADGVVVAAPIWNAYMKKVLEGTPVEVFKKPDEVKTGKPILDGQVDAEVTHIVDAVTSQLIPANCLDAYPAAFATQKTLKETHTILFYLNKDEPRGDPPADPAADEQFANWEAAVQKWAKKQKGYVSTAIAPEDCHLRDAERMPTVTINEPTADTIVAHAPFTVSVSATPYTGRTIQRVELYLDGQPITTMTAAPYIYNYAPTNANGTYDLEARVYDDVENMSKAVVTISLQLPSPTP